MTRKPTFSPSLMCMDLLNAKGDVEVLDQRADAYHIDLMDGHFAPNITLSPDLVKALSGQVKLPMDIHMMVTTPTQWIEVMAENGATWISPHAETINVNAFRIFNQVEALGMKAGVVLNPSTPLVWAQHYLERVDLLTFMTVDVGFAGQPFIEQVLPKVAEAAEFRERHGLDFTIQIDGSCNKKTFKRLWEAGADRFIVGTSGLWGKDPDLNRAYDVMLAEFSEETGYHFD
ncbi:MAG: D-allulose 6-phosphate 3-epimerase [Propionicimonas sp.]